MKKPSRIEPNEAYQAFIAPNAITQSARSSGARGSRAAVVAMRMRFGSLSAAQSRTSLDPLIKNDGINRLRKTGPEISLHFSIYSFASRSGMAERKSQKSCRHWRTVVATDAAHRVLHTDGSDGADSTDAHSHLVFFSPSSFFSKKRDKQIAVSRVSSVSA
jgi:hypothetical protein